MHSGNFMGETLKFPSPPAKVSIILTYTLKGKSIEGNVIGKDLKIFTIMNPISLIRLYTVFLISPQSDLELSRVSRVKLPCFDPYSYLQSCETLPKTQPFRLLCGERGPDDVC